MNENNINWEDWNEEEENTKLIFDLDNEIYPSVKIFNLNDRVEFIYKNKSYFATVIHHKENILTFEFDDNINGRDGYFNQNIGKNGHCWNYCEYYKKHNIQYIIKWLDEI
jgi:hypothetical protein